MTSSTLWISWQNHRRTSEICAALNIELHPLIPPVQGLRKYPGLIRRTWRLLQARRPKAVIVQNPSIVLTALAVLLRPLFNYALVVDAHNEAVEPYQNKSRLVRIV